MRGKVPCRAFDHVIDRITPAYAGKSRSSHTYQHERQDHPRLCGEKIENHHFWRI